MERLADLHERHGLHGASQHQAGTGVRSPVWDAWLMVRDFDPRWLGIRYDVRHAAAEGSRSWELGDVSGGMTLHYEYPLGGADKGKTQLSIPANQVIAALRRDLDWLRRRLKAGLEPG